MHTCGVLCGLKPSTRIIKQQHSNYKAQKWLLSKINKPVKITKDDGRQQIRWILWKLSENMVRCVDVDREWLSKVTLVDWYEISVLVSIFCKGHRKRFYWVAKFGFRMVWYRTSHDPAATKNIYKILSKVKMKTKLFSKVF